LGLAYWIITPPGAADCRYYWREGQDEVEVG
jgi:hypothetical protein